MSEVFDRGENQIDLCLIIPCFNEGKRLNVKEYFNFLELNQKVMICFSNDGSTDDTLKVLKEIQIQFPKQVLVNTLDENHGKAEAVRRGVQYSLRETDIVIFGYCDADLATPLKEMSRLKEVLEKDESLQFVFGARWAHLGVNIKRKASRHYLGRFIASAISLTLGLVIYDTQCGAKVFTRHVAQQIFKESFVSSWLFDVELFAVLINHYGRERLDRVALEVSLNEWNEVEGSKVTLLDGLKSFYYLYCIRKKYKL